MPAATTYYPYTNTTPNPQSGVMNPYGAVPGVLSPVTPSTITSLPNPSADLSGVVPGLNDMNNAASGDILGQLSGNLSPATLAALLAEARFAALPEEALLAVNRTFCQRQQTLEDGDEVALMPPVSGG